MTAARMKLPVVVVTIIGAALGGFELVDDLECARLGSAREGAGREGGPEHVDRVRLRGEVALDGRDEVHDVAEPLHANAVDVFRATFPAGTLSGAPKPRALEIIDELEPAQRGLYGGVVGYFGFGGDADLAIAIRTATITGGVARVQAGGGLVADSVPESEFQESQNKAAAPLRAVAVANAMRRVR